MLRNSLVAAAITLVLLSARSACAQGEPASGFYQITSGQYIACCGIGGEFIDGLPDARQAFVALTVDSQHRSAQMAFLGEDMKTVFRSFSNGMVFPDRIQFVSPFGALVRPPAWNYTVSNAAGALRINGTLYEGPICCDIPNKFTHTNVVAVLIPAAVATIRVSEVEVCWNTDPNRTYQVQYRSALDANVWINLGSPLPGNGSTNCITDKVPLGQPKRFYRVLTWP